MPSQHRPSSPERRGQWESRLHSSQLLTLHHWQPMGRCWVSTRHRRSGAANEKAAYILLSYWHYIIDSQWGDGESAHVIGGGASTNGNIASPSVYMDLLFSEFLHSRSCTRTVTIHHRRPVLGQRRPWSKTHRGRDHTGWHCNVMPSFSRGLYFYRLPTSSLPSRLPQPCIRLVTSYREAIFYNPVSAL
jgi:hypothetical protein